MKYCSNCKTEQKEENQVFVHDLSLCPQCEKYLLFGPELLEACRRLIINMPPISWYEKVTNDPNEIRLMNYAIQQGKKIVKIFQNH